MPEKHTPVPGTPVAPGGQPGLCAAPVYPEMARYPREWGDPEAFSAWRESFDAQHSQSAGYADSLTDFFRASMAQFLGGEGNQAYSPINLYLALAMAAECAEGESRSQLLALLGADSIEALRTQAAQVWNAHYNADGRTTSLLANSLWLDDGCRFRQDTASLLARHYYAAVYHGALGTKKMNAALQDWLNAQTGGLLEQQAKNIELAPGTVFALASAICFSAGWETEFRRESTHEGIFHTKTADVTVPFLYRRKLQSLYRGEGFQAVQLGLSGGNRMWLILPREDKTPQDIAKQGAYLSLFRDPEGWEDQQLFEIELRLPKFDITSQRDLVSGMKQLGITHIFDAEKAELSGLVELSSVNGNPHVSMLNHAVRVAIDEEGVTAAAFTVMAVCTCALIRQERIAFTLDRPFLFAVTDSDGLPLFAGVVEEP